MTIELRTSDHPEANGRRPQAGEHGYTFTFPLESGTSLRLQMGQATCAAFQDFLGRLLLDEAEDGPPTTE